MPRREGLALVASRVILTVTLNAAIDRTVAVPNFRLGQRHRAVEARTVAGGKGVNVARALRLLGRPVIATGLAGGRDRHAAARASCARSRCSPTSPAIAGESRTNLAVDRPDHRRADGDQRARPRGHRSPRSSASSRSSSTSRRGASICVLAGSVPPGAPEDIYARLVDRAARARRPDRARHRRRADARRRSAPSPRLSPRTCPRPRRRSATSSTTPTTSPSGSRACSRWGPAEAIITSRDGLRRRSSARARERRRYEVEDRPARAGRHRRLGRLLPRRLRRRAVTRARVRATASPSGSPAAPSRPSTSAPARSTVARSSGCCRGSS